MRHVPDRFVRLQLCFLIILVFGTVACEGRSPSGRITESNSLRPGTFTIGSYRLTVTGENADELHVQIHHSANPDRVLWENLPGQSFLMLGRGAEEIHEARGSFFIDDDVQLLCREQVIDSIGSSENAVRLSGSVRCPDGQSIPYTFTLEANAQGHLRFESNTGDTSINRTYLAYASDASEGFYGFGEQFTYFDLKGRKLPIFVMEQGIGRGAQPITAGADLTADSGGDWHTSYAGVPHYITSQLRSLFLENYEYSSFDLREGERVVVEVFSGNMRGRILYGESPLDLIESYTLYSGRMRALPAWIQQGAIIGMQGGTEKVREVYAKLSELGTPLAAFWLQDWEGQRTTSFGKQLWWNWELDNEHYPAWPQLVRDLERNGVRTLVYINPFLADASEKGSYRRNLFAEAAENGYLIKNASGEPYMILNTSFSAGLIDLSNPAARTWIKRVIQEELIAVGASGWMADFGEALPYDAVLHEGDPLDWHIRYPEVWQEVNREAINEAGRGDDIVFFSRSGYTRSPGITTLFWLGDQLVSWDEYDGIKTAVTGLLSSGISGYSLNHSDIGGYTTITNPLKDYHRSKELLLRWIELAAFNAVFRTHEGNRPDENHQIYSDAETLAFFDRFARVFAALAPYRQRLTREATERGWPIVRHPFLHYPEDHQVREIRYEEFMLGEDFLIAPVLDEGQTEVDVYLPRGRWVHLWSGEIIDAGSGLHTTMNAPLGQPAVFYRDGSATGANLRANLESQGLLESR